VFYQTGKGLKRRYSSKLSGRFQNTERKLGCLGDWQSDRYKPRVGAGDRRFLCRPRRRFQPQEEDFR
jgi:hypothetical protein